MFTEFIIDGKSVIIKMISSGSKTDPRRTPQSIVFNFDILDPVFTTCTLFVKKVPRSLQFSASCRSDFCETVLNACLLFMKVACVRLSSIRYQFCADSNYTAIQTNSSEINSDISL